MHCGTYHFGNKLVACRNAYCTTCEAPRFCEGRRSIIVLSVFYIPLLPIAKRTRWFCAESGHFIDAHRPNHRFILRAGVFFGIVLTAIGLMVGIETEQRGVAVGCMVCGPMMVAGLVYLLRRGDYEQYMSVCRAVEPLNTGHCPYCGRPTTTGRIPRCHSCRVNILSGIGACTNRTNA